MNKFDFNNADLLKDGEVQWAGLIDIIKGSGGLRDVVNSNGLLLGAEKLLEVGTPEIMAIVEKNMKTLSWYITNARARPYDVRPVGQALDSLFYAHSVEEKRKALGEFLSALDKVETEYIADLREQERNTVDNIKRIAACIDVTIKREAPQGVHE